MTIKIETKSGVFNVDKHSEESILFSGLADGLTLPYECATGTCGSCRARVMSGDVEVRWEQAPALAKLKRDKGDILMCQTHAKGDCVVRVPAEVRQNPEPRPERVSGTISLMRPLTHDVTEFEIRLEKPISFEAGQFVVVAAEGGPVGGRAYSMVNYEGTTDRLLFVVKRKPGGGFSEWLFTAPRTGNKVEVFGALGRATFTPADQKDIVIVAGGSGIAGMMAILERAVSIGHFDRYRGRVFFGVRTLADGFYVEELSKLIARAGSGLEVTLVLSHETPDKENHPDFSSVKLGTGFVHEAAANALAGGGAEASLAFLAGPPPMVDGAIRSLLMAAKIPVSSIRYDKFG